jgi:putative ABC transport system permease protein
MSLRLSFMSRHDLRYALRSLRKSPGFAAVAVGSLGLGLALVTTMVALLDAATHPYVPYRDPDRLYDVRYWLSGTDQRFSLSWVVTALRERTRAFEVVLPYSVTGMSAGGEGRIDAAGGGDIAVAQVPARFFAVLGVKPSQGRVLDGSDAGGGAVVVSDALWRQRFAGRHGLAGASITLGERRYAVVGVMPGGMQFPRNAAVWLALPDSASAGPDRASSIMIKLRAGVSREGANAELAAVSAYLTRTYHVERAPFAFYLWPLRDDPMRLGDIHFAMLGAALAVLLIACANLANLMLARGLAKRREVALRLAIGASRSAVIRMMFLECALLTAAGTALAVALSVWGVGILHSRMPRQLWWLGIVRPQLGWRVFAFAALAAGLAAVLFGLLPAARVAGTVSLDEPLKDGAGTTARSRRRYSALVISEVALALVLLMGAGLLLKMVHRTASYEFNFAARRLLRTGIFLPKPQEGEAVDLLGKELAVVAAVRAIPGVVDAAAESGAQPPGGAVSAELEGDSARLLNLTSVLVVTPGYLRTMGLPVLQGRDFEPGDLGGGGVVVLNSAAAARLYPRQRAAGRMLKLGAPASSAPWLRIVGVCRTRVEGRPGTAAFAPDVYAVRRPDPARRLASVYVRTAREDARITAAIQAKLKTLGTGVGYGVWPYLAWWEAEVQAQTFLARMFVTMGAFALLLAAVGVYGVLAYAVNRRLREFAVRIAVGARRVDMLKLVLHDGLVMALAGTGLGAFGALWAEGLLTTLLEDQQVLATDVVVLIASEVVLLAVTLAACLAPAFRAMRADPIEILRAT